MISDNIEGVKANIEKACRASGRDIKEVCLICVSKTKPVDMLKEAYRCRCARFWRK